ncbi:MAG: hypothetical protein V2J26_08015 [Pacificimonas sp.]|nr:hypothetical protein [Pacificimonas sp.]
MAVGLFALVIAVSALASLRLSAQTPDTSPGEDFFYASVVPAFVNDGCVDCHATGHVRPMIIFYEEALPYLAMGDSPENSMMLVKLADLRDDDPERATHVGGQRCASLAVEPCKTIVEWWQIEFGGSSTHD